MIDGQMAKHIEGVTSLSDKVAEDHILYLPKEEILIKEYKFNKKKAEVFKLFFDYAGIFLTEKYLAFGRNHGLITRKMREDIPIVYYGISERGNLFLDEDPVVIAEIDKQEMLLLILESISDINNPSSISEWHYTCVARLVEDIFPFYDAKLDLDFTESRLDNLSDRRLVSWDGNEDSYQSTKKGDKYLEQFPRMREGASIFEKIIFSENDIEIMKMRHFLLSVDPYDFEELIRRLLKKMGYRNTMTTSKSNDKGVDVIGEIVAGTSVIKEIIQVKRWKNNIQRPTLDQFRGALVVSDAVKGSIFTTSDFSPACYELAANDPSITLVNGDRLIELLTKHGIGLHKHSIDRYTFNAKDLQTS